jgi:uncharacterized membrane protein
MTSRDMADRRLRTALRRIAGQMEHAPLLIAAAKVPVSFRRTLLPRSTLDQGIVTGVSMTLDYTVSALVRDGIEVLTLRLLGQPTPEQAEDLRWWRVLLLVDLTAMGIGVGVQRALRRQPDEHLERAIGRTAGYWLTTTGLAGAVTTVVKQALRAIDRSGERDQDYGSLLISLPAAGVLAALQELHRRRRDAATDRRNEGEDGWQVAVLPSLGVGAGVSLLLGGIAAAERASAIAISRWVGQVLPGRARWWRPLGHTGALLLMGTAIVTGSRQLNKTIEEFQGLPEPPFDRRPASSLVSGGPGSLVPFETLGRQGRRNVSTVSRAEWIRTVMEESTVATPIRVYVGVDSAASDTECVRLALDELDRTGAFDRALLLVIAPTGTGYINHIAVEAAEFLSRGNIASVAVQYAKRPSILTVGSRAVGNRRLRMLIDSIHARIGRHALPHRPRVVLFGESLGAWVSQDAFIGAGTEGLRNCSVDNALWIGTPFSSKWKQQVLHGRGRRVDRDLIGVFDNFGQVEALTAAERDKLRYFMITHHDDPVAHWGLDLLVQSPPWLDEVSNPSGVPAAQRWVTPQTFVEMLIDMKNASKVVPGLFESRGHDYRADLLRFVSEAYRLPADERQLTRIEDALRRHEVLRKQWIDAGDIWPVDVPR